VSANNKKQKTVRLYGCGGTGINLLSVWEADHDRLLPAGGLIQISYVDTSDSNLPRDLNKDRVYLLEGKDGSGKVRSENSEEISRSLLNLLQKMPEGDFNIVLFSASGGSGSVFGPLLMAELAKRGVPTVGIVVGTEESVITCDNTLKTLKTLENLAERTSTPMVISYHHNKTGKPRSQVDIEAREVMSSVALLGGGNFHSLDTRDISNWITYRTTNLRPQLSLLHVYDDPAVLDEKASDPISIASLRKDPDQATYSILPMYPCEGFVETQIEGFDQLHYVINTAGVAVIHQMIDERVQSSNKMAAGRVERESLVSKADVVSDSGLVF